MHLDNGGASDLDFSSSCSSQEAGSGPRGAGWKSVFCKLGVVPHACNLTLGKIAVSLKPS